MSEYWQARRDKIMAFGTSDEVSAFLAGEQSAEARKETPRIDHRASIVLDAAEAARNARQDYDSRCALLHKLSAERADVEEQVVKASSHMAKMNAKLLEAVHAGLPPRYDARN